MIPKNTSRFYPILTIGLMVLSSYLLYDKCNTTSTGGKSYCDLCCNNFEDKEPNIYELGFVKNLVDNYANNQLRHIKNGFATEHSGLQVDAQSVWFSTKELKNFIYNIEKKWENNCNDCTTCDEKLGVRFYFGAYAGDIATEASPGRNLSADYSKLVGLGYDYLHTLALVPTYYNNGENVDFSSDNFDGNCTPTDIMSFLCNNGAGAAKMNTTSSGSPIGTTAKVMALIGGAEDKKLNIKQSNTDVKKASIGGSILAGVTTTAVNHGNLYPPPFTKVVHTDAKFLNPCPGEGTATDGRGIIANPPSPNTATNAPRNSK